MIIIRGTGGGGGYEAVWVGSDKTDYQNCDNYKLESM